MGTFIPLFNRHKMVGLAPHFTKKALFSSSLDWVVDNAARSKSARRKLTLRVAGLKQLPLYYLLWSGALQLSSTLGNYSNNDGQTSESLHTTRLLSTNLCLLTLTRELQPLCPSFDI